MTTRILQITPRLEFCGVETQRLLLARGLSPDRFDVHACALHDSRSPQPGNDIPTTVVGTTWKLDPRAILRLRKIVRRLQPDIVHTWGAESGRYAQVLLRSANATRIVASEQVEIAAASYGSRLAQRRAGCPSRIVANSSAVADTLLNRGVSEDICRVIPNGVEVTDHSAALSKRQLCRELSIPDQSRLIITVNRLCNDRRIKDLIWASDLLKCVRDDIHLLVVGDGPQRWRLERYRRQCEIDDRVHFLGTRADLLNLLPHCECLWQAGDHVMPSNTIMEAMAASLPVVATDVPSNRELVLPRETGFLVPLGDRAAFAKWTNVLLNDDGLSREMGRRGRHRMRQEFSVDRMVQRYTDLYQELLN